jgi:hypothetical protein
MPETPLCSGIRLNNRWNMVGFACAENKNSVLAFSAIDDKIVIIKDTKGNTYLPSYGSNGISDFQ